MVESRRLKEDTAMAENAKKCIICGNDKPESVYIKCVAKGVDSLVCAACMPTLIHGEEHCH